MLSLQRRFKVLLVLLLHLFPNDYVTTISCNYYQVEGNVPMRSKKNLTENFLVRCIAVLQVTSHCSFVWVRKTLLRAESRVQMELYVFSSCKLHGI
jgi:hypothetical protein